jgi:hypothetical protein
MARLLTTAPLAIVLLLNASRSPAASLPPLRVPDAVGVNIHFTTPQPGEFEMLVAAGFKVIRTDIIWDQCEKTRGAYDFSHLDGLFALYEKHHLRAMAPLLCTNPLYDQNLSPHTDEGVAAFAKFAIAAVEHFQGRGVIWEIYNEPNNVFWRPQPDVNAYIKLALATAKAIKAAAPDELVVGPALSGTDGAWLEPCYKAGLLDYFGAVSVHPYGNDPPEGREVHYRGVRALIDRYQPRGKFVPILSGEWGYTATQVSPETQGKLLARQWLFNLSMRIPLSIWYDWRDDGSDASNAENRFGVVENAYHAGKNPVLTPKPAYFAAKTLTTQLNGFTFARRVPMPRKDDYVVLFRNDAGETRAAAWTTAEKPHVSILPARGGAFGVTDFKGAALPDANADESGLSLELTDGPKYLVPKRPGSSWRE